MAIMRIVSRLGVLLLAALVGASLTACGGVKQTLDPVAAAAAKTQGTGVKMTFSMALDTGGSSVTMTGDGAFDNDRGTMNFQFGSLGTAKMLYLTENGDPVMYMNLSFLNGKLPQGKTWIRLDLQKAGQALGVDFQKLMSGAGQNPADSLKLLQSHGDFTEVGKETIDGIETTHYHGTVDLQQAAQSSGMPSGFVQQLINSGAPTQFPIDAWVDGNGYLRQFEEKFDQTTAGKTVSEDMTTKLSDYGTTVDVSAPPADQVYDATSQAVQGIQSSSTTTAATTTTG